MRAAIFNGPGAVEAGHRPDPVIQAPTGAMDERRAIKSLVRIGAV